MACSPRPHSAPDAPPAASAHASPARHRTILTPQSASAAACAAAAADAAPPPLPPPASTSPPIWPPPPRAGRAVPRARGRRGTTLHPDAVITVPGDVVEPPEFVYILVNACPDRLKCCRCGAPREHRCR